MSVINVVCMYCGKDMGTKDGQGVTGTSHGICPECLKLSDDERMEVYRKRVPQSFREFIEK